MGKQSKNQALGKVYREFSRQKYNKYKAQFPKLRQSQIVTKIIKEWDALDLAAKENLQKIYEEKNFLTNQDISSSEALKKADHASKEARIAAERSAKKKTPAAFSATRIHANVKQVERDGSDFNRGSEQRDDSRVGQTSSPALIIKTKPIAKASQSDYINFFKHHYKELAKNHKRWSTQQITTVIKLLWKKRKNQGKTLRKKDGKLRTSKPLTGRRYFRKCKGLDGKQGYIKWRLLPLESKNNWTNESLGIQINNTNVEGLVKYSSAKVSEVENSLSYLSKHII